jgi:hypothetical protein
MIAAIYARKSTEQSGVADEQKSVLRKAEVVVVALMLALGAPTAAQDMYPRGRIIGSVEIPVLHDEVNKGAANPAPGSIA